MRDWNLGGLAGSLWRKDPPETADKLSTAAAVIRNFNFNFKWKRIHF